MSQKPKYLTDYWTVDDHLFFSDFRPALETILEDAETPLTVGVFGPWGSGKTSLMRMIHGELKRQPGLRTVLVHGLEVRPAGGVMARLYFACPGCPLSARN